MLGENPSPLSEDDERGDKKTQRAILTFLLAEFPARHTEQSLWWMGFGDTDALDEAIEMLDLVGLIWRDGSAMVPTAAARHFEWLELS
jgi:hypothetical protein